MLKTVSSIVNAIGALNYKGTWNASTNSPALASGVGTKGDYYVVSVAGSTNLDGETLWGVGDWAVFNGAAWQKLEGGATINATTITASGTIGGGSTIGVGAATPSASGAGITFPATQSASTDANTLDDYEEGAWTPELTPTTGAFTTIAYGGRVGRYTKIGRLVTVEGYLFTTGAITLGTAAGMLTISGLPFTTGISSVGTIWTNPVTASYNSPLALPNKVLALGTSLQMYKAGTVNDAQFIVTTDLRIAGGNSNYFAFTATYTT